MVTTSHSHSPAARPPETTTAQWQERDRSLAGAGDWVPHPLNRLVATTATLWLLRRGHRCVRVRPPLLDQRQRPRSLGFPCPFGVISWSSSPVSSIPSMSSSPSLVTPGRPSPGCTGLLRAAQNRAGSLRPTPRLGSRRRRSGRPTQLSADPAGVRGRGLVDDRCTRPVATRHRAHLSAISQPRPAPQPWPRPHRRCGLDQAAASPPTIVQRSIADDPLDTAKTSGPDPSAATLCGRSTLKM